MNILQIVTILTLTAFSKASKLQALVSNGLVNSGTIIVAFETKYGTDERGNCVVCQNDTDCLDLYTPGLQNVDFSSSVVFDPICEFEGSDVEEGICTCGDHCYSSSNTFDDDTFYYCGPCGRIGSICNDTIKCEDPGICEGDSCLCPNGGTFYEAYYCYIPYYGYEVALQMAVTTCIIIALCLLVASIYNAIGMRRLRRLRGLREILRREEGVRESPPDDVPPKYDDVIGDLPTYQEALHLDQGTKKTKKEGIVNLAFEDDNGHEKKQCQFIDEGETQAANHFQTCDTTEPASIQENPPEYNLIFTLGNCCNDPELNRNQSCRKKTKVFRKREDTNHEDRNSELIRVMNELDIYQRYFEGERKRKRNSDKANNKEFNIDVIESDADACRERSTEADVQYTEDHIMNHSEDKTLFKRSKETKEENLDGKDSGNDCHYIDRYDNIFKNKIKNDYDNDKFLSDVKIDQCQAANNQPKIQYEIYDRQISDNGITSGDTNDGLNFSDRKDRDVSVRRKRKRLNTHNIYNRDFEINVVPTTHSVDSSNLTTPPDYASSTDLRYSNDPYSTALTIELSDSYNHKEKKIPTHGSLKRNPVSESDQKGNNEYDNFAEEIRSKSFEMTLLSDERRRNEDGVILSTSENLEDSTKKVESSV